MDNSVNRRTKPLDNRIDGNAWFTASGSANVEAEGLKIKLIDPIRAPSKLTMIPASHKFLCFHVICPARVSTSPKLKFTVTPLRHLHDLLSKSHVAQVQVFSVVFDLSIAKPRSSPNQSSEIKNRQSNI